MTSTRKLKVFLCHASEDKPKVQELYSRLKREGVDAWLDKENLLPGSDWEIEIRKAVREADVVAVCLSKAFNQAGYRQKEVRIALDAAMQQPEGEIFIIPARLEECENLESLKKWHWVDLFEDEGYQNLVRALRTRANSVGATLRNRTSKKLGASNKKEESKSNLVEEDVKESESLDKELYLYKFIEIPKDEEVPYTFYIGKYPVTNAQYERFVNAPDFANPVYWLEFPKFDENCERIGDWGQQGLTWLREELKKIKSKVLFPRHWEDKDFGIKNPTNPIVGISWYEANAYCEWLFQNWDNLSESKANVSIVPQTIRLPLETEWQKAAGGITPVGRYAWDEGGKQTASLKEILHHANIEAGRIRKTTSVDTYPLGRSPYDVMDMSGNVWEWQANYQKNVKDGYLGVQGYLTLCGGSWANNENSSRVSSRHFDRLYNWSSNVGFRVVIVLPHG